MFSLESPQFEQGLEILRTIDRIDPNRVRLLLQSKIITNSKMATTMFAVTAPGRASLAQGRVTEVMTRAGAPIALDKDTKTEGVFRSPGTVSTPLIRQGNESEVRQAFGLQPDSAMPDDVMSNYDSFYRFTYADLSTRPAAPVTDAARLDALSADAALNSLALDWAPVPRPGRGPIMVRAGLYGIGSNAQLDVPRATKLGDFFAAAEVDTGGFVKPENSIRIGVETLTPVISRDIDAVTARESVLAFAAIEPQTGTRRLIKKDDPEFAQALQVIETGRPLNPLVQIKRKTGEANSVSQADLLTPLPDGRLRGQIILNATVDQWMRQNVRLPSPNFAPDIQDFQDMLEQTAIDLGFPDGIGTVEEEPLEQVQAP